MFTNRTLAGCSQYKAASAALARLSDDLQTLAAHHAPAQVDGQSSAVQRLHPEAANSEAGVRSYLNAFALASQHPVTFVGRTQAISKA